MIHWKKNMENITSFNFAIYEKNEKRDIKKVLQVQRVVVSINNNRCNCFFGVFSQCWLIDTYWFVVFLSLHKQSVLNFESISRVFVLTSGFSSGGLAWKKTPRNYAEVKAFRTIHGQWHILGSKSHENISGMNCLRRHKSLMRCCCSIGCSSSSLFRCRVEQYGRTKSQGGSNNSSSSNSNNNNNNNNKPPVHHYFFPILNKLAGQPSGFPIYRQVKVTVSASRTSSYWQWSHRPGHLRRRLTKTATGDS